MEDQDPVRKTLLRQLEALGYQVTETSNSEEALEKLRSVAGIDLLLSDMVMPGQFGGAELARQARAIHPHLPVVFLSGYPQGTAAAGAEVAHGDKILMKPVKMSQLSTSLREVFDAR